MRLPLLDKSPPPRRRGPGLYAVLILATVLVAVVGYAGYLIYPRFNLPSVTGGSLLLLAAAAGVASFFSPCSFPLLVTLLARETGSAGERSLARSLLFALWLSVGAVAFLLLAGSFIALGARALFSGVTFASTPGIVIRAVVGSLLIFLGLVQLKLVKLPLHRVEGAARPFLLSQAALRRERPAVGFALFGFGYLLAGFG